MSDSRWVVISIVIGVTAAVLLSTFLYLAWRVSP